MVLVPCLRRSSPGTNNMTHALALRERTAVLVTQSRAVISSAHATMAATRGTIDHALDTLARASAMLLQSRQRRAECGGWSDRDNRGVSPAPCVAPSMDNGAVKRFDALPLLPSEQRERHSR